MHKQDITVRCIGKTEINLDQMTEWVREMGFETYEFPTIDVSKGVTPSAILIMAAAKQCYAAFDVGVNPNLKKVRTDLSEYLENIFKSGHGSVTEHASFSFAINGCTRVFTAEMNRHRAGVAISERSLRYVRFDDIGYWEPDSLQDDNEILKELDDLYKKLDYLSLARRKQLARSTFERAFRQAEENYQDLCNIFQIEELQGFTVKKLLTSMFRRIIPMGCSSGGVWTLNVRALRHVLEMRGSAHAEEEIFVIADKIADIMVPAEPFLFGDFEKIDGFWKAKYHKV